MNQKNLIIAIGLIVLIGGTALTFTWMQSANRTPDVTVPTPSGSEGKKIPYAAKHELLATTDGKQTIKNTACDFTFVLPADWTVIGLLGESKILSPANERENETWAETHQNLLMQNQEGEAPLGPDARTLYISCQYNLEKEDLKTTVLKTIQIDGVDAYEIADTGPMPDGTPVTNHRIIVGGGRAMDIHLGQTEYDNLSETVKQIIQSISFE